MSKIAPLSNSSTVLQAEHDEARSDARRRMLKTGRICFNERHSTLECAVRDISDAGARLRLSGSIDAPDTFELFIELDGTWVECAVIWRSNGEIGVIFTSDKIQEAPTRKQVLQNPRMNTAKPTLRRKPIFK